MPAALVDYAGVNDCGMYVVEVVRALEVCGEKIVSLGTGVEAEEIDPPFFSKAALVEAAVVLTVLIFDAGEVAEARQAVVAASRYDHVLLVEVRPAQEAGSTMTVVPPPP